jgi:hypothetical protein
MKGKTVLSFIIILLIFLQVSTVLTRAATPPLPPCLFYGHVYVDGSMAQDDLNVTAVISGATLSWTTQTKNGTYGLGIPGDNASTPEIDGGSSGNRVQFYVQGIRASQTGTYEPGGAKNITLTTFSGTHVVIDQASSSHEKADVSSVQTVRFHAKWGQNDSDVTAGIINTQNKTYVTDATGWISFKVTSSTVGKQEWTVSSVNCSGVTTYVQTASNPSIVWDRILIVDGGLTRNSITQGETVTAWFKAVYEYDNTTFDNTNASSLYVNGSASSWSTPNNRWEYNFTATTPGTDTFIITGASDSLYGLTAIHDNTGAKTLTVSDQPILTGPVLYGAISIIITAGLVAIYLIRRRGYSLKIEKKPNKKSSPRARTNELASSTRPSKRPTGLPQRTLPQF